MSDDRESGHQSALNITEASNETDGHRRRSTQLVQALVSLIIQ